MLGFNDFDDERYVAGQAKGSSPYADAPARRVGEQAQDRV